MFAGCLFVPETKWDSFILWSAWLQRCCWMSDFHVHSFVGAMKSVYCEVWPALCKLGSANAEPTFLPYQPDMLLWISSWVQTTHCILPTRSYWLVSYPDQDLGMGLIYWLLSEMFAYIYCSKSTKQVDLPRSQATPTSSTWSLAVCNYGGEKLRRSAVLYLHVYRTRHGAVYVNTTRTSADCMGSAVTVWLGSLVGIQISGLVSTMVWIEVTRFLIFPSGEPMSYARMYQLCMWTVSIGWDGAVHALSIWKVVSEGIRYTRHMDIQPGQRMVV